MVDLDLSAQLAGVGPAGVDFGQPPQDRPGPLVERHDLEDQAGVGADHGDGGEDLRERGVECEELPEAEPPACGTRDRGVEHECSQDGGRGVERRQVVSQPAGADREPTLLAELPGPQRQGSRFGCRDPEPRDPRYHLKYQAGNPPA